MNQPFDFQAFQSFGSDGARILAEQGRQAERFAKTLFASFERTNALALSALRESVDGASSAAKSAMAARTPQEVAALAQAWARPLADKSLDTLSRVHEISCETRDECAKICSESFEAAGREFGSVFEKAAKNAPAGADVAVNAVRNVAASATAAGAAVARQAEQAAKNVDAQVRSAVGSVRATAAAKSKAK